MTEQARSEAARAVTPPESIFVQLPPMVVEVRVHTLDYHPEYGHVGLLDYPVGAETRTEAEIIEALQLQGRSVKEIRNLENFLYSGFVLSTHRDVRTGRLFKVMHRVENEEMTRFEDEQGNDGIIFGKCRSTEQLWLTYFPDAKG